MPETPPASHGEAGAADETVQVIRRTVAEFEQETSNEEDGK